MSRPIKSCATTVSTLSLPNTWKAMSEAISEARLRKRTRTWTSARLSTSHSSHTTCLHAHEVDSVQTLWREARSDPLMEGLRPIRDKTTRNVSASASSARQGWSAEQDKKRMSDLGLM